MPTMRRCHRMIRTCVPKIGEGTKPAREQARKDRTDQEHGIVEKELMNGRVARREASPRAANQTGTDKGGTGGWGKGKGKGKSKSESETRCFTNASKDISK